MALDFLGPHEALMGAPLPGDSARINGPHFQRGYRIFLLDQPADKGGPESVTGAGSVNRLKSIKRHLVPTAPVIQRRASVALGQNNIPRPQIRESF